MLQVDVFILYLFCKNKKQIGPLVTFITLILLLQRTHSTLLLYHNIYHFGNSKLYVVDKGFFDFSVKNSEIQKNLKNALKYRFFTPIARTTLSICNVKLSPVLF